MPRRRHPKRPPGRLSPAKPVRNAAAQPADIQQTIHARELFWNNVMREILTALSVVSAAGASPEEMPETAPAVSEAEPDGEPTLSDPLDGRLAVVTNGGERIPIAAVYPLFACGVPGSASQRTLSIAVECTVFQIRTPSGEVYTLPLHEIRGFHAMSESLMQELAAAAQGGQEGEGAEPFGFAAFTSLARAADVPPPTGNLPDTMEPGI